MGKIIVFHHNDADGYASAAVIAAGSANTEFDFRICKHGTPMNFDNINDEDEVFIVDYSFSNPVDKENIIKLSSRLKRTIRWIDHHATSDDIVKENPVFKKMADAGLVDISNKYAGCALSYFWVTGNKSDYSNVKLPLWVELVSDYDTWTHKYPESKDFVAGLGLTSLKNAFINIDDMYSYINFDLDAQIEIMNNVTEAYINKGKIINQFREQQNKTIINSAGFEANIVFGKKVHKVLCCNAKGNSLLFGDRIEDYDFVMVFEYNGNEDLYKYTMFSKKDGTDVGSIAKFCGLKYGITGGGHYHAAGFSSIELIFRNERRGFYRNIDLDIDFFHSSIFDPSGKMYIENKEGEVLKDSKDRVILFLSEDDAKLYLANYYSENISEYKICDFDNCITDSDTILYSLC